MDNRGKAGKLQQKVRRIISLAVSPPGRGMILPLAWS